MNLGQMMMAIGAIVMLGVLILNTNSTIYQTNDIMYTSEFGVTADIALDVARRGGDGENVRQGGGRLQCRRTHRFHASHLPGSLGPEAG
jgi:hypothetical protein